MRVLTVGSGGREHALVWKLAQSPHVTQMWCAPGNAGIEEERLASNGSLVECAPIAAEDLPKLLAFAKEKRAELTVVGPDNPLALGIVDLFQSNGLRVWGPNRRAAQFESSKAFSQQFMEKHGIATARSGIFDEPKAAKGFAASLGGSCAVKADGLALGKGVLICKGEEEANRAIEEILVEKTFGTAGARIVIQELLEGIEVSLHALCDGKVAELFPVSQDHKRALDGDRGANTGGMGAYCPAPFLNEDEQVEVRKMILDPWLRGCAEEGIDFHGILYPGIMLTKAGPKVLEFNARFGDPETQVYLPRMENDLVELFEASIDGKLGQLERGSLAREVPDMRPPLPSPLLHGRRGNTNQMAVSWREQAVICVVMVSGGYPGNYSKGKRIHGLDEARKLPNTKIFHAGTVRAGDNVLTNGGRVLGVTAWAKDLRAARDAAYAAVERIGFEGAQWRKDIAEKALRAG
jgi:phosphoribosylamine--glycine ligase